MTHAILLKRTRTKVQQDNYPTGISENHTLPSGASPHSKNGGVHPNPPPPVAELVRVRTAPYRSPQGVRADAARPELAKPRHSDSGCEFSLQNGHNATMAGLMLIGPLNDDGITDDASRKSHTRAEGLRCWLGLHQLHRI